MLGNGAQGRSELIVPRISKRPLTASLDDSGHPGDPRQVIRSALFTAFAGFTLGCAASTPTSTTPAAGEPPVVDLNAPPPAETAPKQALSGAKTPAEEAKRETSPEEEADDAEPAPSNDSRGKPGDTQYGVIGILHGSSAGDAFGAGGLGLTGVGGGGGQGSGSGIGSIGTLGHGTGAGQGVGGTAPAATPAIRTGATAASGSLPPEVIRRVVRSNFSRMQYCYEVGLQVNPALTGKVVVQFVIGRDGKVTSVTDGGSQMPDPKLVACVQKAFSTLVFPQPDGGIVRVNYPINFSPGDTTPPAPGSGPQAPKAPPPPPQTR